MGKRGPAKGHGGRPRKSVSDKLLEGNPGKRAIRVINNTDINICDDIDIIPKTLSLQGADIYVRTVAYLRRVKCENIVNPMLIEQFALNRQRWLEVETLMDKWELDTDIPKISELYQNQMRKTWDEIFEIVNDNCTEKIDLDCEDDLDGLLSS